MGACTVLLRTLHEGSSTALEDRCAVAFRCFGRSTSIPEQAGVALIPRIAMWYVGFRANTSKSRQ